MPNVEGYSLFARTGNLSYCRQVSKFRFILRIVFQWRFASLDRCKISDWSKANVFFRQYQVQTLVRILQFVRSIRGID